MNKIIKDIINSNCTKAEKNKTLDLLSQDISVARDILLGKYKYCSDCDDYYLNDSFLTRKEIEDTEICVYENYINSGNNEYEKRYVDVTYSICPKGHKHEISRSKPRR